MNEDQKMPIKIVVPVSGGKDSQCCLKLAVKKHGPKSVVGLFCDTQFEHPLTYQHIEDISNLYGVDIVQISLGSVEEKILKYNRFPGGGARHCTDELKIRPSRIYYERLAKQFGYGFEVWYGVRSDESPERKKRYAGKVDDELYLPHEFMPGKYPQKLGKLGVRMRLPIIDWSKEDVISYLDGEENPLYREGFDRVGCFPCLAGGDKWKEKAFNFDEFGIEQYKKVIRLEGVIGKSIWTSKGGKARNCDSNGCSICSM